MRSQPNSSISIPSSRDLPKRADRDPAGFHQIAPSDPSRSLPIDPFPALGSPFFPRLPDGKPIFLTEGLPISGSRDTRQGRASPDYPIYLTAVCWSLSSLPRKIQQSLSSDPRRRWDRWGKPADVPIRYPTLRRCADGAGRAQSHLWSFDLEVLRMLKPGRARQMAVEQRFSEQGHSFAKLLPRIERMARASTRHSTISS